MSGYPGSTAARLAAVATTCMVLIWGRTVISTGAREASRSKSLRLGNGQRHMGRAAHIFRAKPDGSGLEVVITGGMNNPVGLAFNEAGERFLSGTFFDLSKPGRRDGILHAVYGGIVRQEKRSCSGAASPHRGFAAYPGTDGTVGSLRHPDAPERRPGRQGGICFARISTCAEYRGTG